MKVLFFVKVMGEGYITKALSAGRLRALLIFNISTVRRCEATLYLSEESSALSRTSISLKNSSCKHSPTCCECFQGFDMNLWGFFVIPACTEIHNDHYQMHPMGNCIFMYTCTITRGALKISLRLLI
jgi:hypothetical protein